MAIRPVDMQVMIHRASEVNRVTNNDGSRAENQNTQFANQFQKAVQQDSKQVVNSSQAEHADIEKDGGRNKGGGDAEKKRQKRTRPGNEAEKDKKELNRSMFDVRI